MKCGLQKLLRFCSLIILCGVFLFIASLSAAKSSARSAAQFGPSGWRVRTRYGQMQKQRDPVRRFFSWVRRVVSRPFRKRVPPISDPPIVYITSSSPLISFCPPWTHSLDNCSGSEEVELAANANGSDELIYEWTVSAGRIRGEGKKVIWDLRDAADGTYTTNVEVTGRRGLAANASTKVTIALCRDCVTKESPCATVAVSCPERAEANQSMTFEAHVYGGDPTVKVTYTWSVSAGKISSGQGTSTIRVDASDVSAGSVTATVSVGGGEPGCVNTASCTTQAGVVVAKAGGQHF